MSSLLSILLQVSFAQVACLSTERNARTVTQHFAAIFINLWLKFLQAGLPDGTHIAKIQDGVALLQCGNDWEVCLSLSPAQKLDMPDTPANASAAQPGPTLEEDQALQTSDSQQKPEGGEAQVTLILAAGSC